MKRWIVVLALGGLVGLGPIFGQTSNQWDFFQTLDWGPRLEYLESAGFAARSPDFFLQVLQLVDSSRIESGPDTTVTKKKAIAVIAIRALSQQQSKNAIPLLRTLPVQYRDPQIRGEAWVALGQLGDQDSRDPLIRALAAINVSGQRGRSEEIQAFYEIEALGALKAPEGFRVVAEASQGWYSPASGVKPLALQTLNLLSSDVDQSLDSLLAQEEDLQLVENLFQQIRVLSKDPNRVARAATAILSSIVGTNAPDKDSQDRIERLTLATLLAAKAANEVPATLIGPLRVLVRGPASLQSQILSVQILGRMKSAESVDILVERLRRLNDSQKMEGNIGDDLVLVKELIAAIGVAGRASGRDVLEEAQYSGYTPAIVRAAADVRSALPRE